jgi:RNA polymerase sigma-70 factor (ECF subfamily)
MSNKTHSAIESNYRALHGKLFSALINQFGTSYVSEIEDAIQNSFLKSLKTWHAGNMPDNLENWLFIVARNDYLNQIKIQNRKSPGSGLTKAEETETQKSDLRLETILLLSSSKKISDRAKVVFILKNIFGLNIREIGECVMTSQEALYKSINRAKRNLQSEFENKSIHTITIKTGENEVETAEEILYAVFNIGFDSFSDKIQSIVNEDICLEALALAKLLLKKYQRVSTKNLLALFCFHIARIPAKIDKGKLVSFFKQDQSKWDKKIMNVGFNYLQKPEKLNRFYIEALIASKYMTADIYDTKHWNEIVKLYKLLLEYHQSPVVKLNLSYALHKASRTREALILLANIEKELPEGHIYLSLVKAELLKATKPKESENIMFTVMDKMEQSIRKEYLLENGYISF